MVRSSYDDNQFIITSTMGVHVPISYTMVTLFEANGGAVGSGSPGHVVIVGLVTQVGLVVISGLVAQLGLVALVGFVGLWP